MSIASNAHDRAWAKANPIRPLTRFLLPALIVLAAGWAIAYATGIAPWLGTATRAEVFDSGPRQQVGRTIGFETFPFMRGQRIFVDYDLKRVDEGALAIRIVRNGVLYADRKGSALVTTPSSGRFEYVVPVSGRYSIISRCHSKNGGCDIAYTTTWGAHSVFESRGVMTGSLR